MQIRVTLPSSESFHGVITIAWAASQVEAVYAMEAVQNPNEV